MKRLLVGILMGIIVGTGFVPRNPVAAQVGRPGGTVIDGCCEGVGFDISRLWLKLDSVEDFSNTGGLAHIEGSRTIHYESVDAIEDKLLGVRFVGLHPTREEEFLGKFVEPSGLPAATYELNAQSVSQETQWNDTFYFVVADDGSVAGVRPSSNGALNWVAIASSMGETADSATLCKLDFWLYPSYWREPYSFITTLMGKADGTFTCAGDLGELVPTAKLAVRVVDYGVPSLGVPIEASDEVEGPVGTQLIATAMIQSPVASLPTGVHGYGSDYEWYVTGSIAINGVATSVSGYGKATDPLAPPERTFFQAEA